MKLLKPFKMLTILGEERGTLHGSVSSVLWGFDMLLELLETERKKSRPEDAPFQKALDASWEKLDKYYTATDKCPVYVVATILDPRMKYKYFEEHWRKDWLKEVMGKMQATYNQYRLEKHVPTTASTTTTRSSLLEDKSFDIHKWRFGNMQQREDELTRYLNAPRLVLESTEANDAFDPLEWWKGNAIDYPTLACIAFNIFSIPSMSVEPERVFSGYIPIMRIC
jgi:hypothetical protein